MTKKTVTELQLFRSQEKFPKLAQKNCDVDHSHHNHSQKDKKQIEPNKYLYIFA